MSSLSPVAIPGLRQVRPRSQDAPNAAFGLQKVGTKVELEPHSLDAPSGEALADLLSSWLTFQADLHQEKRAEKSVPFSLSYLNVDW